MCCRVKGLQIAAMQYRAQSSGKMWGERVMGCTNSSGGVTIPKTVAVAESDGGPNRSIQYS